MITYEKALEKIDFLERQLADVTAERDRLRAESANASEALSASHGHSAELSSELTDAINALDMMGVSE